MQTPMASCHLIPTWHEWNANADDVMVTCFTSYVKIVTSLNNGLCILGGIKCSCMYNAFIVSLIAPIKCIQKHSFMVAHTFRNDLLSVHEITWK